MSTKNFQSLSNFIWSVADLLRGPYRPPQYERVMLPMTVLRRFDCVLEYSKAQIIAKHEAMVAKNKTLAPAKQINDFDPTLNKIAKDIEGRELGFHNHSPLNFQKLKGDPDNVGRHLQDYINGFSKNIREIFDKFEFDKEIEKMEDSNRLYLVVSKFAEIDLHPERVDNITMGLVFEDLIRRFNESANETAGDHFTPREVIRLMVDLLMEPDGDLLTNGSPIVTICDPACGTGGMLSESQNWIRKLNESAIVKVFGQDYNPRSYAVAASDLLIKGHKDSRITKGNTLTNPPFDDIDGFDYLLANPPFGVDWKAEQKQIAGKKGEVAKFCGYEGKLPRVNDGALLFLLYMLSKRQDYAPSPDPQKDKRGTRIAVVFNGSPLFTGGAGSGESDIRRWVIENDWLEAIVALPEQMFYNTGIGTFIWIVTNRKTKKRKGKIQLIDCRERYRPMPRSLGDKRRYLDQEIIDTLSREHGAFKESETSKIFDNIHFGYRRITIERPLRLRFQITDDAKEMFLNSCPELFDAVEAIEETMGTEPHMDWNTAWPDILRIVKDCELGWDAGLDGTRQKKFFRECFTETDPKAAPVIAKRGSFTGFVGKGKFPGQKLIDDLEPDVIDQIFGIFPETKGKKGKAVEYEADPKLRDNENVPLKEGIVSFFLREVRPFAADAWINADPKEGFIEDVLKNYVTYKTYYKLLKSCNDDPNVERKKAAKALARFMRLHPHNISQKTVVMVEHFQSFSRHKIGGQAKAMVITGSRLEAVRYKQEFDNYIAKKGYDIRSLVAFSGTVIDDKIKEKTYTEPQMNGGIREKDLPDAFATRDYQVLLVAEKYQTGFDQPLLHTMYVDRRLDGIQAVQTLSRLNRTHPLKEDTFILDFVNDPDEIQKAFKVYYEGATLGEEVEPERLYEIKAELDGSGIYRNDEIEDFCRIFFAPRKKQSPNDHKAMNAVLDKASNRFEDFQKENEEEAELWRKNLHSFRNLYAFLSQVIPYQDSDLEKLYAYLKHLALKLPKRKTGPGYQFDDEVQLEYYRLQKISEGSISLSEGVAQPLDGPKEVGTGMVRDEQVPLSRLIDLINERFGENLSEADQLFFDQITEAASQVDAIRQAAENNPIGKFQLVFGEILESLFIERMDLNEELFARYMNDPEFKSVAAEWLGQQVYSKIPKAVPYEKGKKLK